MRAVPWLLVVVLVVLGVGSFRLPSRRVRPAEDPPRTNTRWPWPAATLTRLAHGVERTFARSADGTELELFHFDFGVNPSLRLELYDQDEDDESPFDNLSDYYERSVADVVRDLEAKGRGGVRVAWNGPFFGYDRGPEMGPNGKARHVAPVVLSGKVRSNVGRIRWTFGAKVVDGVTQFALRHEPTRKELAETFDFAGSALQCLVKDGRPLGLAPKPFPDDPPRRTPVPSTAEEAGHIPLVDFMRTSRTSMAWSRDSKHFYLLVVNEPDHELGSKLTAKYGGTDQGGWNLRDLQTFWLSFGADYAVNSDGGAVTQTLTRLPDGSYEMLPPRLTSPNRRIVLGPELRGAPKGGTLLTFFVRDVSDQP